MGAKKLTNVHEALEYLENLDESSEDVLSYDGDFICSGRLVILPPTSEGERDTDEDSRDENELLPNNLNRSQVAPLLLILVHQVAIFLGAGGEEEITGPSVDLLSKRNNGSKVNTFL